MGKHLFINGYLGDSLDIDTLPQKVYLCANTGIGKSTLFLKNDLTIIAFSSQIALKQAANSYPAGAQYWQDVKDISPQSRLILTTYESLPIAVETMEKCGLNLKLWTLVIDEAHNFALAGFRRNALTKMLPCLSLKWKRAVLMSGTPIPVTSVKGIALFQPVWIASEIRTQKAVRVIYKTKKGKGDLFPAVVSLIMSAPAGARHVIFLDDKGAKLDKLKAELLAAGIAEGEICTINADVKGEAAALSVISEAKAPAGCKVLIVTSLFVESANLVDSFDYLHICGAGGVVTPEKVQQLANRLRDNPFNVAYWYTTAGIDDKEDTPLTLGNCINQAHNLATAYAGGGVTPAKEFVLYGVRRGLVTSEGEINGLGVLQSAYSAYCSELSPNQFKGILSRYGWQWGDDMRITEYTSEGVKIAAEGLKEEREALFLDDLALLLEKGEAGAEVETKFTSQDNRLHSVALKALDLTNSLQELYPAGCDNQKCYNLAIGILANVGDSGRGYETVKRKIEARKWIGAINPEETSPADDLLIAIYQAFKQGEALTSEQIHQRLTALYQRYPAGVQWLKRDKPTCAFTTQILGCILELEATTTRKGKEVFKVYTVIGHNALYPLLTASLVGIDKLKARSKKLLTSVF
jgi:hypothetical protein